MTDKLSDLFGINRRLSVLSPHHLAAWPDSAPCQRQAGTRFQSIRDLADRA